MQLSCPLAARKSDEYALWLELRDPEQSTQGRNRLEEKLRDQNTALGLRFTTLLSFGIKLDLDAVERDIDRNIAINGGMTTDSALARFAPCFY